MKIGILGGGAWGTALAQVAARGGAPVKLWARETEVVAAINESHENRRFLAGVALSPSIHATAALADLAECDALLVSSRHSMSARCLPTPPLARPPLVLCAKGIEAGTQLLVGEVAQTLHPAAPIAVLSGPTFAHEVAAGLPTAVTARLRRRGIGAALADRLASPELPPLCLDRCDRGRDWRGRQNVWRLRAAWSRGPGLGQNARAALIARGFAEMTRFGIARGAQVETLSGLSGLGDLVLTCSSTASRNFSLGLGLGQGKRAGDLLADRLTVAEGAFTARYCARQRPKRTSQCQWSKPSAPCSTGRTSLR